MATAKTPKTTNSTAAKESAPPAEARATIESGPAEIHHAVTEPAQDAMIPAEIEAPIAEAEPAFVEPIATLVPATALQHDVVYAALPGVEDLLEFGKANVEAVIATGQHLAHGMQQMTESLITWSHGSIEKSLAAGQALVGMSSVEDAVALTQKTAQQSLEDLLAEGNHLTSLSTKLLEEAFAPLQSRVKAAVEKISSIAA